MKPPRRFAATRVRLAAAVFATCGLLGMSSPAYATHFRYGNLTWAPVSARTVNFHLTDAFRRSASPSFDPCVNPASASPYTVIACTGPGSKFCANGGSIGSACTTNANCGGSVCSPLHGVGDVIREDIGGTQLDFGDGTHTPTGATPMVYVVTSIDATNNWTYADALDPVKLPALSTDIAHAYAGVVTTFTAKVDDCCRISANVAPNGHINNPDKQYTLSTNVTFAGDSCPVSTQVPIVNCEINSICTFSVPASDANGDPLRWRLATASEASSANNFVQPGPPNATNAASINASTGLYTWNTTGATLAGGGLNTLYSTQVIIEDLTAPNGTVKCRTPVDFLIQLVPHVNAPPVCNAPSPQNVMAGNPLSFVASGSDPDAGDTVTLNAAGLPAGSTMTPPLPVSGTTVNSTFNWTPGVNDVGVTVVQYSVTDDHNQQKLCSVTINVSCNISLCGDGSGCTDDTCSVSGCVHTNNTASCNDGNACTSGDVCSAGACVGGGATDCNDGNVCTTDGCSAQTGCTHAGNANACSDGNVCTTNDVCSGGNCQGGAALNCNDNNVCTNDTCNAQTGCAHAPNTAPCSDGDACTLNDACGGGACGSGPAANCDDGNACTVDSCSVSLGCQHVTQPNCQPCTTAADCSNGNACDGSEQCVAGQCQSGAAPNCNDGNLCTDDGCAPATGCTHMNNNDPCSDGNACTTADACSAGACAGGPPATCNDANVCTTDSCNVSTGCVFANNAGPCDDGSACTTADVCGGGTCHGGPPAVCNDGNGCTTDSCTGATGCVFTNNTLGCDDGDACTTTDVCGDGACSGGPPPPCNDSNPCTDDDCDPGSGCTFTANDRQCDDGNPCTTGDECDAGACDPGGPTDCGDGNVCTTDSCDDEAGCQHDDNSDPCSDGDGCTVGDTCAGGACTSGGPKSCDDQNGCTNDSCDPPFGTCVNDPNTNACDDGNACTAGDVCAAGSCAPGGPTSCDDGNGCTDDSCSRVSGCVSTNNNAPCNDGSACTTADTCAGGGCVGGPAPSCNDNNVCTSDGCSAGSGCFNTPNALPCTDDNACTTGDVCSGGTCQPGGATGCNDSNDCTADSCVAPGGCQHAPLANCCNVDAECTDTDLCTQNNRCAGHACLSDPVSCGDGNGCTDDGCNPQTGCTHLNNADPCNDGNACTTADACSAGSCAGGPPPNCITANICLTDSCNPQTGCVHSNNANPCSDGSECTENDACRGGQCVGGGAPDCSDQNGCTNDACDPDVAGGCVHTNNADECDDGNPCSVSDQCGNGSCAGLDRDCTEQPADNPCTVDICDNQGGGFLCEHTNCLDLAGQPCPSQFPLCGPGSCGNGRIDDPREACDPPDQTPIPGVDPPQVACRADCTFCGDGTMDASDSETCDDGNAVSGCDPQHPTKALDECQRNCTPPICHDPAKIQLGRDIDRFDLHARLTTESTLDFSDKTFVVELTDPLGKVIYRASLDAGAITGDAARGKFKYKNKLVKEDGGVAAVKITRHDGGYRATIKMYGDLTDSQQNMTTRVHLQDDLWTVVGLWLETHKGWKFTDAL